MELKILHWRKTIPFVADVYFQRHLVVLCECVPRKMFLTFCGCFFVLQIWCTMLTGMMPYRFACCFHADSPVLVYQFSEVVNVWDVLFVSCVCEVEFWIYDYSQIFQVSTRFNPLVANCNRGRLIPFICDNWENQITLLCVNVLSASTR